MNVRTLLLYLLAVPPVGGLASAQYLEPTSEEASLTDQNPLVGAQRIDLDFSIEDIRFDVLACSETEGVLRGCEFKVVLQWKTADIPLADPFNESDPDPVIEGARQSEARNGAGSDHSNGDDQLVVLWQTFLHWRLISITRDGESIFAGATQEGTLAGNGTIDGVRITPPSSFERGEYNAPAGPVTQWDPAPAPLVYHFKFAYVPLPGDECEVVRLLVGGHYIHTYDGLFTVHAGNTFEIAGAIPWGLEIGGAVTFANNHAWSKQLVNPGGTDHWKELLPPEISYPREDCCGEEPPRDVPPPRPPVGEPRCEGVPDDCYGPGQEFHFDALFRDDESGLMATHLEAWSPDGVLLGYDYTHFEDPLRGELASSLAVEIPRDYPHAEVIIVARAFNAGSRSSLLEERVAVSTAKRGPSIHHRTRLSDGGSEIVARGFTPGAALTLVVSESKLEADLDLDMDVDDEDLRRLLGTSWPKTDDLDDLLADLDGDLVVDGVDEALLRKARGTVEGSPFSLPGCEQIEVLVREPVFVHAVADDEGVAVLELPWRPEYGSRIHVQVVGAEGCEDSGRGVLILK